MLAAGLSSSLDSGQLSHLVILYLDWYFIERLSSELCDALHRAPRPKLGHGNEET